MRILDIVFAGVLMVLVSVLWSVVLAATPCRDAPGIGSYWSWREVEGRKCWYSGKVVKEKSELTWPVHITIVPARTLTEYELNYQIGIELLKKKFEDVDDLSNMLQAVER